ncbi:MAG: patatin [Rhodoplanes sp.]
MEPKTFEVGIVMAGAISAGAYTAGVMDFIIEALNAYEEAKREPGWNGPTHDVRIPILAGASAGGMTAAIAALHTFHGLKHVWPGEAVPESAANRLYSSWVKDVSIEALLETTDLDDGGDVDGAKSALCCDVLAKIVNDAFILSEKVRVPHWAGSGKDHFLRVLLTVTNLRGVPYSFKFFGDLDRYGMLNHGDYLDFTVGLDPPKIDGSISLNIADTRGRGWNLFRTAALATGAFPIGLMPRKLDRETSDYRFSDRVVFEDLNGATHVVEPDDSIDGEQDYPFVAVDGGVIDNEPFEITRRHLSGAAARHNERAGKYATKAVVLVDPFPNTVKAPKYDADDTLVSIVPKLFSALMDQARFKPEELKLAEQYDVYSRFIICPRRRSNGNELAETYPIASAVLGGFGGFLHHSFRRHDYLLGRRNAQAFLKWGFALPETNPLFDDFKVGREDWYVRKAGTDESRGTVDDSHLEKFSQELEGAEDARGLPIIPLVPRLRREIQIGPDDLPKPEKISLDELNQRITRRAGRVLKTIIDVDLQKIISGGLVLRWAARSYATRVVTKQACAMIKAARDEAEGAFRATPDKP